MKSIGTYSPIIMLILIMHKNHEDEFKADIEYVFSYYSKLHLSVSDVREFPRFTEIFIVNSCFMITEEYWDGTLRPCSLLDEYETVFA